MATEKKATGKKSSARKYGPAASKQVETEMHEFKLGKRRAAAAAKR